MEDAKLHQELYQDRLREYKQLEADIAAFNTEMYNTFKKQQAEVSKYEADNKKLTEELSQME